MINRKEFLGMAAVATSGIFMPTVGYSKNREQQEELLAIANSEEFILKNVRLEIGFEYNDDNKVKATKTALYNLHIKDGVILELTTGDLSVVNVKQIDAGGLLMLPSFSDMHIHIDKTFYGQGWNAEPINARSVKDMIELERQILPDMLLNSTSKAEKAITLLNSKGSCFARCQTNVEPTSGLRSLENLKIAIENKKDNIESEIVAFPQHGIIYSDSEKLLREAASLGVDYIGGLDPTTVDGNMQRSLDIMLSVALDYNKGVDIHLHESAKTGIAAIEYLINKVRENKALQARTYISHGFALAQIPQVELEAICEEFADLGIGVISTVPIGKTIMPIPTFYKYKVKVMTGTDSIVDHWSVFGSCDMLEKARLSAELYGWRDEFHLSRALKIATKDQQLPLDDKGKMQWPKKSDQASFVLVDASCSAQAVARLPKREYVFYKGKRVV